MPCKTRSVCSSIVSSASSCPLDLLRTVRPGVALQTQLCFPRPSRAPSDSVSTNGRTVRAAVRQRGRKVRGESGSVIGRARSLPLARLAPRAACPRVHDQRQLEHSLRRQLLATPPSTRPTRRPTLPRLTSSSSAAPLRLPRRPAASASLRARLAQEDAGRVGICAALARERTLPRSCS